MRARVALLLCSLLLALLTTMATPAPAPVKHASGITLVGPLDLNPPTLSGPLAKALSDAWMLTRFHAADLGLPWADARTNTLLMRAATPAGDALVRRWTRHPVEVRVGAKAATLSPAAVPTTIRAERRTFAEVDRVLQDAIGRKTMDLPDWQLIFTTEPDFANNRVIITIDRMSDSLLYALAARFGTDIIAVRVERRPRVQLAVGRDADNAPFWGGAQIWVPAGACSSGFPWLSGSQHQMLSAGHCAPDGGSVSTPISAMGSVTPTSGENWDPGVGTVALVPDATQPGALRGDLAIINVTTGSAGFQIYRGPSGSSTSSAVAGKGGSPVVGESICSGGYASGDQCDFHVTRLGLQVSYFPSGVARNEIEATRPYGTCVKGGDSGGPVFTTNPDSSVMAKGIIGAFGGTGTSSDPCRTYFTDIWDAYWGFPGDIKTTP